MKTIWDTIFNFLRVKILIIRIRTPWSQYMNHCYVSASVNTGMSIACVSCILPFMIQELKYFNSVIQEMTLKLERILYTILNFNEEASLPEEQQPWHRPKKPCLFLSMRTRGTWTAQRRHSFNTLKKVFENPSRKTKCPQTIEEHSLRSYICKVF